jgi:hypothetical protein
LGDLGDAFPKSGKKQTASFCNEKGNKTSSVTAKTISSNLKIKKMRLFNNN